MAVGKKWYSYFVVTGDPAAAPDPSAESPEALRASDVVADDSPEFPPPAAGATDLNDVYDAAKIGAPAHGYTVLKVAEMLRSEHIRALPPDVKKKSVMVALDAAGVKVTDIVEDAVRRDRALDTYERVLQQSVEEARARATAENARIEDEIARHVAERRRTIDENNKQVDREQKEFHAWQTRKRQEEATIAEAVGYFVSENPITKTPVHTPTGDADVR